MAAAFFRIFLGQQDLCNGDAVAGQRVLVSMGEPDLSGGCGGLLFLQSEPPSSKAEMPPSHGNRAGGHKDHLLTARSEAGDVVGERIEPWPADLPVFGRKEPRPDFHHEPPCRRECLRRGGRRVARRGAHND